MMLWWDRQYLDLVKKLGFKLVMYQRYVDDADVITKRVRRSVKYDSRQKRLINDDLEDDDEWKNDKEMMEFLREIADDVTEMIKWEADWP